LGTDFYGSNDPNNSVKALKEQNVRVHDVRDTRVPLAIDTCALEA